MKKLILILLLLLIIPKVSANSTEDNLEAIKNNISQIEQYQNSRNLLNDIYPVGSIYITTSATNPGTIVGGTWVAYAQGRTLIGVGGSNYTSASLTGGSSSKTITTANLPSHNHSIAPIGSVSSTFKGTTTNTSTNGEHGDHYLDIQQSILEAEGYALSTDYAFAGRPYISSSSTTSSSSNGNHSHTITPKGTITNTFTGTASATSSVGSGTAIKTTNPYITVYMWRRTA